MLANKHARLKKMTPFPTTVRPGRSFKDEPDAVVERGARKQCAADQQADVPSLEAITRA